jgi:hypothetical protein
MAATEYYTQIIEMLQGQTPELRETPRDRLDWAGPGAVLDLYKKTSGRERVEIIEAMERILANGQSPSVMAQVLHIAASLDIAQLEPYVEELRSKAHLFGEPVRLAVNNYLAFRKLRTR